MNKDLLIFFLRCLITKSVSFSCCPSIPINIKRVSMDTKHAQYLLILSSSRLSYSQKRSFVAWSGIYERLSSTMCVCVFLSILFVCPLFCLSVLYVLLIGLFMKYIVWKHNMKRGVLPFVCPTCVCFFFKMFTFYLSGVNEGLWRHSMKMGFCLVMFLASIARPSMYIC